MSRQDYRIICGVADILRTDHDIYDVEPDDVYDPCFFCCLRQAEKAGQLPTISGLECDSSSYYMQRPDQRWRDLESAWDAIQD
jgi:hypothetical protein